MSNALFDVEASGAGSFDVLDRTAEQIDIVGEPADGRVAPSAERSTDDSGLVVMVDMELLWSLAADGADTALALDHLVVLGQCDPVEALQGVFPTGVGVRLPEPSSGAGRGAPLGVWAQVGDVRSAVQAHVGDSTLVSWGPSVLSLCDVLALPAPAARNTLARGECFVFEDTVAPAALEHGM